MINNRRDIFYTLYKLDLQECLKLLISTQESSTTDVVNIFFIIYQYKNSN